MSLRRRVLLGCIAVGLVLLVADVALAGTFRRFLLTQVDERLTESAATLSRFASEADRLPPRLSGALGQGGGSGPGRGGLGALSEFYVAIADADGQLLGRFDTPLRQGRDAPQVPADQVVAAATAAQTPFEPFTVRSVGEGRWRMVAVQSGTVDGAIILVGASLDDVGSTYRRMIAVLVMATATVFATLAAVAWWVLRQGVGPLTSMTATAGAIAEGALHERIDDTDDRTEAGRLGTALNTMLTRIEGAFAEKAATEDRLRRFVADASHELRTPLTSIRGYAELYRTGALRDPESLDGAMRRVEREAQRMGVLVEDLLLLAKLDEGRPLERRPVDLAAIAADAVADLRAVDPDRHVSLEAHPAAVIGDDARLRQAVGNLLANVRAHTPPGTPVTVALAVQHEDEGGHAVLTVTDEGPGMAPQVAGRVFERFYRADASRSRATGPGAGGQGAGLGLSIVAGIIEAHGGDVGVETIPGRGTRFRMRLPLDI